MPPRVWRTPLPHNPWAGPSVAGELVILGCSSIRFDPKELAGAKGEVLACNLKDGQVRWRKDVSGGIIAPIAIADDLAICAGTDGKVRALNVKDGQQKWEYDGSAGFFGGAAISAGVAYLADLKSVVHAIQLKDGSRLWRLDLGADPAVRANGMVYGSPVLHNGRLYLGTCSLESGQQRNVVVCIGS
jgi:outer membrane protein assembly factor BamB